MKILTGKTLAITLIAGLLTLANVENHADELDSYLDNAMRTQVFEELKANVQRLYEDAAVVPVRDSRDENLQVERFGFPVAKRGLEVMHPAPFGILN